MFQIKFAVSLLWLGVFALSLSGCDGCGQRPTTNPAPAVARAAEEPDRQYGAGMQQLVATRPVGSPNSDDQDSGGLNAEVAAKRDGELRQEAERRGMTLKQLVLLKAEVRSQGRPWGRNQPKKMKPFKYFYVEVPPSTVKSQLELVTKAADLKAKIDDAGIDSGRPFLLIMESRAGWMFTETVRVAVPVKPDTPVQKGLLSATFDSSAVFVEANRKFPENGKMDEMERWAEDTLKKASPTGEVDFSGPFMLRFTSDALPLTGDILFDWVIPGIGGDNATEGAGDTN